MRKVLFAIIISLTFHSHGQEMSTFNCKTAEVIDGSGDTIIVDCNCGFIYTDYFFFMSCIEKKIHSFLLPGTEFKPLPFIKFDDTGWYVNMSDSTGSAMQSNSLIDSTMINNIGVIYRTADGHKEMDFIQYVERDGLTLIKRDKTKVKFKY